jgi:hypothetical protein
MVMKVMILIVIMMDIDMKHKWNKDIKNTKVNIQLEIQN